jgi:hypothetical protein
VAYPDPKIVTVAAPTNQGQTDPPHPGPIGALSGANRQLRRRLQRRLTTAKQTELARVLMGPPLAPGADPPAVAVGPQHAKVSPANTAPAGSIAIMRGGSETR